MLILYSIPGTCALAVHIALEWSGMPYRTIVLKHGENYRLDYLKINPLGSVPALQISDDIVLTEAAALLTYVDAERSERFSVPPRDSLGRAMLAQTLSFYTTELHAAFAPHFAPVRFHPDPDEHEQIRKAAYQRLERLFDLTDDRLTGSYVFGEERSVADAYLYVLTRWLSALPLGLERFPLLAAFKKRMEADADVDRVLRSYA